MKISGTQRWLSGTRVVTQIPRVVCYCCSAEIPPFTTPREVTAGSVEELEAKISEIIRTSNRPVHTVSYRGRETSPRAWVNVHAGGFGYQGSGFCTLRCGYTFACSAVKQGYRLED